MNANSYLKLIGIGVLIILNGNNHLIIYKISYKNIMSMRKRLHKSFDFVHINTIE
ncbi:DUF4041 domain-containing protein [Staphylococcus gallinarum]|nr:DUF4041 domain-containing protein [Staphylococcus gallinarum]